MHRLSTWLLLLAAACGASPAHVAPAAPDACGAANGLVVEAPEAIPSRWSGALILGGTGTVTLRWCGTGEVIVDGMQLDTGHGGGAEWAYDPAVSRLAPGQSLTREITGTADARDMPLTVRARRDDGTEITATAVVHSVLDPRFVAERDACLARHGTFAPAGMAGNFLCNAPTHDAGRRCLSSADCESACLDDHTEATTSPPDGRTCAAGEEIHLHVGACSASTLRFGCSPLLDAVETECIVPGALRRHHVVCVD